jgi:regulator of sigma E protease
MDFLSLFGTFWNILLIMLGVGFLIFVHELGHFLFAKKAGVRVHAFSLGFGPALFSKTVNETEYRIGLIPLGGYVKMAGETVLDESTGAGDELTAQPAWQRFQIFIAGVMMNMIVAVPIFGLVYLLGIDRIEPVVGTVFPGSPEAIAGFQPGDQILSVDGQPIDDMESFREYSLLNASDEPATVLVQRGDQTAELQLMLGNFTLRGIFTSRITVQPDSWASSVGLESGDTISAVNGSALADETLSIRDETKSYYEWGSVEKAVSTLGHQKVDIVVLRKNDEGDLKAQTLSGCEIPAVAVMPETIDVYASRIGSVVPGSPAAAAGLVAKETITHVSGVEVYSWKELTEQIVGNAGNAITIATRTDAGEAKTYENVNIGANGKLGIQQHMMPILGGKPAGSIFDHDGIQVGDRIDKVIINGKEEAVESWEQVYTAIQGLDVKSVGVVVSRGGATQNVELNPSYQGVVVGVSPAPLQRFIQYSFGASVKKGFSDTWAWTAKTFQALKQLVTGRISATNLAGPAGIAHISYKVISTEKISKFLLLLGIITVNLAVVNLLPLPILDGGHILFLIIEKLKGSPISEKTFLTAQYVGLAMILFMVVFVTYNDIGRIFGGGP